MATLKCSPAAAPRLLSSNGRGHMQLDRFVKGALPLWAAMICFNCGGSTSHVGTVVPPDSQQTGAGGTGSQPGEAGTTGSGGDTGSGGSAGTGGSSNPLACADIFDQG